MSVLLKPYESVGSGKSASRFYLADCLEVFQQLPSHSVDVIVTSPPYNLGIQYSRYQDSLSPAEYLGWTNRWVAAAARVLRPDGSLFLNVGAKPSDPWTALDVAQAVRSLLRLQNIIHWIKSIVIDRDSAGAGARLARDLAVGHYKPINSDRFVNDCHEIHLPFHTSGIDVPRSPGPRRAVPGSVQRRPLARSRSGRALPWQHVVHSVRNNPASRSGSSPSRHLPVAASGAVPSAAWPETDGGRDGSVHRTRQHGRGVRTARRWLHRSGSR